MNLVFVNSFEKVVDEIQVITAQVTICQSKGLWIVKWSELAQNPDCWFEGDKWQEMLIAFRLKIAEKTKIGFIPILEGEDVLK